MTAALQPTCLCQVQLQDSSTSIPVPPAQTDPLYVSQGDSRRERHAPKALQLADLEIPERPLAVVPDVRDGAQVFLRGGIGRYPRDLRHRPKKKDQEPDRESYDGAGTLQVQDATEVQDGVRRRARNRLRGRVHLEDLLQLRRDQEQPWRERRVSVFVLPCEIRPRRERREEHLPQEYGIDSIVSLDLLPAKPSSRSPVRQGFHLWWMLKAHECPTC